MDGLATCQATELSLAAGFHGAAAGQFTQTFSVTNVSRTVCALNGWPALNWESVAGRRVRMRSLRVVQGAPRARPFKTVVLEPRGVASFDIYGEDSNHVAGARCPNTDAVSITPPGSHGSLSVSVTLPVCGRLYIAPLIAGRTDRLSWSVVWHHQRK
jgi:hypothetical protein